jgi:hypothetical protein
MDQMPQPGDPRWQYAFSWRYGHLLLIAVGLALLGFGASGLTATPIAVTMLPLGMILLVLGVALPRLRGSFTAGPTGVGADMLRLDEVDPTRVTVSLPAGITSTVAMADGGTAADELQVTRSIDWPAPPPVTIGDVWDALTASGFRPISGSNGMGTVSAEAPNGQRIKLPTRGTWDYGVASSALLAVLAALDIQPVASGKYVDKHAHLKAKR